jgi:UDP-glucuronate decarboxylase
MADKKRALVTGGAGFLGGNLCARLLREGWSVECLDNLYTGSRNTFAGLVGRPDFRFIEHDVREGYEADVDVVFNLACPASPPHYRRDPLFTTMTSVLGARNALEAAQGCGALVVQASTSEVYGDPEIHPQTESYRGSVNPIGPRACYDEGKRCAESLFFDYRRVRKARIKVARIFNTYGPGMDPADGRVVSNFIVQALAGRDITVYGDGGQTRSFCYVDDLVEGLLRLAASPEDFAGPVNLGNPGEFTILGLATKVLGLVGGASRIVHEPLPEDDPKLRRPDIGLARRVLGWEPYVALDEGLPRTVEYFRSLE